MIKAMDMSTGERIEEESADEFGHFGDDVRCAQWLSLPPEMPVAPRLALRTAEPLRQRLRTRNAANFLAVVYRHQE